MGKKGGNKRGEVIWQHSGVSGPSETSGTPPSGRKGRQHQPAFQLRQSHDDSPAMTTGYSAAYTLSEAFPLLGRDVVGMVLESCDYDAESAARLLSQMCVSDASASAEEQQEEEQQQQQPARRGDAASAASARRGAAWGGVGSPSSSLPSPWSKDPPSRGEGQGEGGRGGRAGAGDRSCWSLVELPSDVLLKLVAFFRPTDTFMASQTCKELRRLLGGVLRGVTLLSVTDDTPDKSILNLIRHCSALDTLKIRGGFSSIPRLATLPTVSNLRLISLKCCSALTDPAIVAMLKTLHTLGTLQIDSCPMVTDHAFAGVYETAIEQGMLDAGVGGDTGWRGAGGRNGRESGGGERGSPRQAARTRCPLASVTALSVSNCDGVTGQGLKYAVMGMVGRGMESAKWVNNGLLQCGEVELVARRLRKLSIHKVNSLREITLKGCMELTELSIFNCGILTSLSLTEAPNVERLDANHNKMLSLVRSDSTRLTTLSLSGCRLVDSVALSSTLLTSINLYGCMSLGNAGLHRLVDPSTSNHLETLTLDGCNAVTKLCLTAPALSTLCLKGCQHIQDLELKRCSSLRSLDVRNCASLSPVRVDGDCKVSSVNAIGKVQFLGVT